MREAAPYKGYSKNCHALSFLLLFLGANHESTFPPTFGNLEQSTYGNWDEQILSEAGKPIKLSFDFHPLEATELAKNAEQHLQYILKDELEHREKMCRYLLGLAQDWYEATDETVTEELSLEEFVKWTWLDYISFEGDGTFSLWYYDEGGKIFAGHVIIAEYDAEGHFKGAGIHG